MVEIMKTNTATGRLGTNNTTNTKGWAARAAKSAIRGGKAGSVAMVFQVVLLMWLRTTVNYQYKHGVDVATAFSRLWKEGGILRFYRGASFALLTGPISRFGDTAANEGVRELMGTKIPIWAVTFLASIVAATWRIAITPLDTVKTMLQVYGSTLGWERLNTKLRTFGLQVLWDGALGNSAATLAGHYPWFAVNNWLEQWIPPAEDKRRKLFRRAFIGFCSSVSSDCVSNGIRVLKTYRQTSEVPLGYHAALTELFLKEGISFVTRGLGLKLVSNGMSGILFSVVWKMVLERMEGSVAVNNTDRTVVEEEKSK